MIIKKLTLYKFKRFFLSNIEILVLEPNTNIHIIVGTNGVGKSSLLSMCNPLPANLKKDFYDNGYKLVEIEHENKEYILLSGGDLGHKHSFLCDGVELNPGGTQTVQMKLCEEHFNITPYSNNIIIGLNRFTSMPSNERKKIFQDISTVDYSFPLKLYNNLKIRHRDIVGGIKTIQDNMIKTKALILEDKDIALTKETLTNLKEYIENIISLYNHNVYDNINIVTLRDEIKTYYRELVNLSNRIIPSTKEELEEANSSMMVSINSNKFIISNIKAKLSKIDTNYLKDDKEIKDKYSLLLANFGKKPIKEIGLINFDTIESVYNGFIEVKDTLMSYLDDLNNYNGVNTHKDNVSFISSKHDALNKQISRYDNTLKEYQHELKHLLSLKNEENIVTCTKCNNTWYNKYDANREIELTNLIKDIANKFNKASTEFKEIDLLKENIVNKVSIIHNVKQLVRSTPTLNDIWLHLFAQNDINTTSTNIYISIINGLIIDLFDYLEASMMHKEIVKLKEELDKIKSTNDLIKETLDGNVEDLEKQLNALINDNYKYEMIITERKKDIETINRINVARTKLRSLLRTYKKTFNNSIEQIRNNHIKILVNELKSMMVELEHKISLNDQYISKVDSDNKSIQELIDRENVLKIMIKELSPTEGLIAKSINSFLNKFIKDMNNVINTIWQYDIEILPCIVSDDNDLDYKFPVRVNGDEVMEDVSKLSSSMVEIVDLAFRLVYIKYSKLTDVPLILDEFAKTFDKIHRVKAYDVIENIFTQNFKQIFIVSHFESMYGRFVNSEITILGNQEQYIKDIAK